jgi:hypothetical protein
MPKATQPELIETTAGQAAAELERRGIAPERRVTIAVEPAEPNDWLTEVRKVARAKVIAKGLTDADIDRLIKEERRAVHTRRG